MAIVGMLKCMHILNIFFYKILQDTVFCYVSLKVSLLC
jgi:hypothetical protein